MYWLAIGFVNEIPRRGARCLNTPRGRVAVFRTAYDEYFALEDRCPHRGGPLSQGIVHERSVTCPLHNWVIALDSGAATGADQGQVARFPVRVEGRSLLIGFESAKPHTGERTRAA